MSIPSDSMSTMKQVSPRCLGACGSVRTMMTPHRQKWAPVFQVFWPSRTQSAPSRVACVVRPATSEPAPGSLKSWHQISSPRAIFLRWRSFCPPDPCFIRVGPSIPIPMEKMLTGVRKRSSSWVQITWCMGVRPPPPYSLGHVKQPSRDRP